ncbi:MAG: hypothetical protein KDI32_12860, partial [Pseudomonadales bacterium]|nr:hypothetical protein [Pseudomonadales bacterium]
EYYALEGLSALVTTIEQIRASVNPELEIEGILRTMFDPRNNLANEVSSQLMTHFGDKVFRTIVPRNVRLAEAPSFGKPVLLHDRESRGALAYLALAGEMIRRDDDLRGSAMQGINQPIGVPPPVYAPSSDAPSTADPVSDSAGQSAAQSTPAPDEQQSSAPTPPEPEPGDRPEAAASVAGSATPFGSHGH